MSTEDSLVEREAIAPNRIPAELSSNSDINLNSRVQSIALTLKTKLMKVRIIILPVQIIIITLLECSVSLVTGLIMANQNDSV